MRGWNKRNDGHDWTLIKRKRSEREKRREREREREKRREKKEREHGGEERE